MRTLIRAATALLLMGSSMAYASEDAIFSSPTDKINYAIGVEIARNYRNKGIDFNLDMVIRGMKDVTSDSQPLLSDKEMRNILIGVQSDIRRKRSVGKRTTRDTPPSENGVSNPDATQLP